MASFASSNNNKRNHQAQRTGAWRSPKGCAIKESPRVNDISYLPKGIQTMMAPVLL